MIKLRFLFIIKVLLLLAFCGCTGRLHQTSIPSNKDFRLQKAKTPASQSLGDKTNPSLSPYDSAGIANNIKNSATSTTKILKEQACITTSVSKKIQPFFDEALDFCQVAQDFWQQGDFESAVESLDQAYSLILKVNTHDESKLIQQKEDLRFMISKRILEIYASRNIVVNGNHNAIPMVMNKYIQKEIELFTKGGEKNFFKKSYGRSGLYRPYIVEKLKEAGLPTELSWLPLIESGFNVHALSKARALGLWQFIPSTGYKFGLKRNIYIDERIDPFKSTKAAIDYLKELHQIFGDWATVLAAYNCGEGRVLRLIRSQNVNYLDNFWDLFERLPWETARYVPKFLATIHIINNKEQYGLNTVNSLLPLRYESVKINKQVHLKHIAAKIGSTEKRLAELNPELRYKITPNDYTIKVPPGKSDVLLSMIDEIPVSYPPRKAFARHKVKPGETLSTLAVKYHTSVKRIAQANNIGRYNFIVAGKTLKIPLKGAVLTGSPKHIKAKYERATKHTVISGDSLWIIARRYGTTTKKIYNLNSLETTNLYVGQVLKIPARYKESSVDTGFGTYTVKRGDSPFIIAKQHNMLLKRFLLINDLMPRSKIYPGQILCVE